MTPGGLTYRCAGPARMRRGFTFVEILATIALMAIVLPSAMAGISVALAAGSYAKQQSQASTLAHGKMMELVAPTSGRMSRKSHRGRRPRPRW